MESLVLAGNAFSGPISSICDLLNVNNALLPLHLSENALSGSLPNCWTYGQNMVFLDVGLNMSSGQILDSIGHLVHLKVLTLADNNFHGRIPGCINNFLVIAEKEADRSSRYYDYASYTKDELPKLMWLDSQRRDELFNRYEQPFRMVDLSSNYLFGEIPGRVAELGGLVYLNLSNNQLTGTIPSDIGAIRSLEALNLSKNQLSHAIPTSMSNLSFLAYLNLSYNKLSGKIPSRNQFLTFDAATHLGNHDLCGPLLANTCWEDKSYENKNCRDKKLGGNKKIIEEVERHGFEIPPFYISMGIGFLAGFWGFWGPLLLNTSWRHAYFRLWVA
ncbi:receptor-like protein EIX2 [Hevea brasiliensis]|uniref:receptor-like protein EIX2 n=1 Tax=Hevea brasiliensis TaxID=3981 RepID=UPI0025DCE9B3|nr:receptor-like protein EIX2 [Hevea brasiliensis]